MKRPVFCVLATGILGCQITVGEADPGDAGLRPDAGTSDASNVPGLAAPGLDGGPPLSGDAAPDPRGGDAGPQGGSVDAHAPDSGFVPPPPPPPNTSLCQVTASDSSLKKVARTMAAGDFKEVPFTAPAGATAIEKLITCAGDGHRFFSSNTCADLHFNYADSAVFNPQDRCLYFYGSGHLARPVNVRYCEADSKWSFLPLPPWLDLLASNPYAYALHAYDGNALDPVQQTLYFFRAEELYAYDIKTAVWSKAPPHPPQIGASNQGTIANAATYFDGVGVLVMAGKEDTIDLFDPTTKQWKKVFDIPMDIQNHSVAEYSAKADVALVGGGSGNGRLWKVSRNLAVQEIATAPVGIGVPNYGSGGHLTEDPVTGNFVYLSESRQIHAYDVAANGWSQGPTAPAMKVNMVVAAPIRDYGVILYADAENRKMWLYKHAGSACP